MDAKFEQMDAKMDSKFDKLDTKIDNIGRHVQNLTITAMAGIAGISIAVIVFVASVVSK